MTERMEERNPLVRLMKKFQKGARPVTHMGTFLPLLRIKERGLPFNDIMRDPQAMAEAALMSFEFGFESTVLPFDLNMEAEMFGDRVRFHDGFDGNSVYMNMMRAMYTHMKKQGRGVIVNVCGAAGNQPAANHVPGTTANSALITLSFFDIS